MDPQKLRNRLQARMPDYIATLRDAARDHAPEAMQTLGRGFSIHNAAGDEAVVRIYDEIWWLGVNAQDLTTQLDDVTAKRMRVEINSPGGDLFDGIAIYNALRSHPAHVTTRVDGLAASAASIIAQAGDTRLMQPSGQMMIHNAWGMTIGDAKDHADVADVLEQQNQVIAELYARHSGGTVAEFLDLMAEETWLTAEATVERGLADRVIEPDEQKNKNAVTTPIKATLHDEIAEAVDAAEAAITSAERVVALRADAGKELSNRNRESLAGLRDRIDQLVALHTPNPWTEDAREELVARFITPHERTTADG